MEYERLRREAGLGLCSEAMFRDVENTYCEATEAVTKRTASSEKVSSSMRKMRRFRPSFTCAKYHPGLCSPSQQSVVSSVSVSHHENTPT